MISTSGWWLCQLQNTVTARVPVLNSTRIHDGSFQTRIAQPGSGVAETSVAVLGPRSRTARPPSVL